MFGAEFSCSFPRRASRRTSSGNANFIDRGHLRSNRAADPASRSYAARSRPELLLGSGLLDLERGALRLARRHLCYSAASRRALGAWKLGSYFQWLALGARPLAAIHYGRSLWGRNG